MLRSRRLRRTIHSAPTETGSQDFTQEDDNALSQAEAESRTVPEAVDKEIEAREATENLTECLAPPQAQGEIGRLGPFRVIRVLGAGGMGAVYQAIDPALGRSVALKVLRSRLAGVGVARERFLREARAAAALEHDHVVAIYQVGEDKGIPYLAMPLLHGQSLSDRLHNGPQLAVAEILRIGREVATGLAAAHDRGLVHRDIKPANIWLEEGSGRVKILDFGLARSVAAGPAGRLTQDGTILGTPAYMAPEQTRGDGRVDYRSDLFSLGSVLYRMATGKPPFSATNAAAMLVALVRENPAPPNQINLEIPPELSALILKLLAKDPDERFPSAQAVIDTIRAIEKARAPREPAIASAPAQPPELGPALAIDTGEDAPGSFVLRPSTRSGSHGRTPGPARTRTMDGNKRRLLTRGWWIAGGTALVLVLGFLAVIDRLPLLVDTGELVLDSPLSAVAVKREGRRVGVLDPRSRPVLKLKPGNYELVLADTGQSLRLEIDRLTLDRGERRIVRVLRTAPRSALEWPAPPRTITAWPTPSEDDATLPGLIPNPEPLPATASDRGSIHWQIETTRPRRSIAALAWSPDRKRIAAASHERSVRIYDAQTLELLGNPARS